MKNFLALILISVMTIHSQCNNPATSKENNSANDEDYAAGTFGYDLNFLQKHDSIIVLKSNEGASMECTK